MNISLHSDIVERYFGLQAAFGIVSDIHDYATPEERSRAEAEMVATIHHCFPTIEVVEGHYLNPLYTAFYKSMGLKLKSVSTPIHQVSRVIKNQAYRSIHRAIDLAMQIEYTTLVSFQLYDVRKLKGDLLYRLSEGDETLSNFHGEEKVSKRGELVLTDAEGLLHSSYYGNNRSKSLDAHTTRFLFRILGVPGIREHDFQEAVNRASTLLNHPGFQILTQDNPMIRINE